MTRNELKEIIKECINETIAVSKYTPVVNPVYTKKDNVSYQYRGQVNQDNKNKNDNSPDFKKEFDDAVDRIKENEK